MWVRCLVISISILVCSLSESKNIVAIENQMPSTLNWELKNPAMNHEIEGYASHTSIDKGESIKIYVNTSSETFTWELFRLGWYGGGGARKYLGPIIQSGKKQQTCPVENKSGLIECDWEPSFSIDTRDKIFISGFYLLRLTEPNQSKDTNILFVVREDDRAADFVFNHSVSTDLAYSPWGGRWMYNYATQSSFNRPFLPPSFSQEKSVGTGYFFSYYDYNLVRWMEKEGYDVKYISSIDLHEDYSRIANAKIFLSVGHDEYYSSEMRKNLVTFRNNGHNLAFFSSNTMYWQVRFEPDAHGNPNRRMICYKDADLDPEPDLNKKTNRFRDMPLNNPEDSLIGVLMDGDFPKYNINIVIRDASHWIFNGTGLKDGAKLEGMLGFEVDRMLWNAPINTKRLAVSTYYGLKGGPSYSDMTLYKHQSGGLVFSPGSMQWIWGLDDWQSFNRTRRLKNSAVEQISRNVFNEMLEPKYELSQYPKHPVLLDLSFQDPVQSKHFLDNSQYNRSVLCVDPFCPVLNKSNESNQTLSFTNKNSYLDLGIEPSIRGRSGFRVELKLKVISSSLARVIIQQRDARGTYQFSGIEGSYQISIDEAGKINFWTWSKKEGYGIHLVSRKSIDDNRWHNVYVTRLKDGSGQIFIDDQLDIEKRSKIITDLKPHTLFLGHDQHNQNLGFFGEIGALKIIDLSL